MRMHARGSFSSHLPWRKERWFISYVLSTCTLIKISNAPCTCCTRPTLIIRSFALAPSAMAHHASCTVRRRPAVNGASASAPVRQPAYLQRERRKLHRRRMRHDQRILHAPSVQTHTIDNAHAPRPRMRSPSGASRSARRACTKMSASGVAPLERSERPISSRKRRATPGPVYTNERANAKRQSVSSTE